MMKGDLVLLASGVLFCLGFLGLFRQNSLIRVLIPIEVMFLASVMNFCYFAGKQIIRSGHFIALVAVFLSGLVLSIVYATATVLARHDINTNLFDQD